jgi:hypothetical protein
MPRNAFLLISLIGAPAVAQPSTTTVTMKTDDVSADGRVVVGRNGLIPVYWTRSQGVRALPLLPEYVGGRAMGVSGDGSVIAGVCDRDGPFASWIWTADSGLTQVTVPGTAGVWATCISRDGRVVGGAAFMANGQYQGFVWTREGGRLVPQGSNHASWIHALSHDGIGAIGSGSSAQGTWAMLWPSTYLWSVSLGFVIGQNSGFAREATPDLSTIVGYTSNGPYNGRGLVWTPATGLLSVPPPPGFPVLELHAVRDDGRLVGGFAGPASGTPTQAWFWEPGPGLMSAESYFAWRGLSVPNMTRVTGMSADGRVIAGLTGWNTSLIVDLGECLSPDFNRDGDTGTDQDIEAFFACLAGACCATCDPRGADFDGDGDPGTDQDIESFFRVLARGSC